MVCNSVNPVPYDPNRQVCCNGDLHVKRNVTDGIRRNYECCARPGKGIALKRRDIHACLTLKAPITTAADD